MKKLSMIITMMLLSSLLLLFTSCEDPVDPNPIDEDKPVVKAIDASASTVLKENSIEVSVEADAASSYEWTAEGGTFSDPGAATTTWTAPSVSDPAIYKLQCMVSNSAGSRKATVSVKVVAVFLPDGISAYWSFDTDLTEEASGTVPEGGVGVSISGEAISGSGAALFEGEDGSWESALFYDGADAPMGPDDLFTISFWVNTEDEGAGFCFGRSFEGEFYEGAKGVFIEEGFVAFDISWVGGFTAEGVQVNDGEWHHIASTYDGTTMKVQELRNGAMMMLQLLP